MTDEQYTNTSVHAQDLEGGRMLAPGESAELSKDALKEPHNAALVEDGVLVHFDEPDKSGTSRRGKGEEE